MLGSMLDRVSELADMKLGDLRREYAGDVSLNQQQLYRETAGQTRGSMIRDMLYYEYFSYDLVPHNTKGNDSESQ